MCGKIRILFIYERNGGARNPFIGTTIDCRADMKYIFCRLDAVPDKAGEGRSVQFSNIIPGCDKGNFMSFDNELFLSADEAFIYLRLEIQVDSLSEWLSWFWLCWSLLL